MQIRFNGQEIDVEDETRLSTVLEIHGVLETAVAVAINRKVVPTSRWHDVILRHGDRVDAIQPVGAG